MRFHALSVVSPAGDWIRDGKKTLEVRRWRPDAAALRDLLIVQNRRKLNRDSLPSDPQGEAVAVVDVTRIRPWLPDDLAAACSQAWTEGYFAWELSNVRPLRHDGAVIAALGIYFVDVAPGRQSG